jgi:predicted lipoprotein with Yx(FWY)xxD motif
LRRSFTLASLAGTIALLAGCGGSTSSTSTTTNAASGAAATQAAPSSPYGKSSPAAATATATTASAPSAAGVQITVKRAKLGEIVAAGPRRLTVYLFEADRGGASACTGACVSVWPPVTTAAAPSAGASAAALGTITRADGTKQVTYGGHPLYFFAQDKDQGDAYGQGVKSFGSAWYMLMPAGSKLDPS